MSKAGKRLIKSAEQALDFAMDSADASQYRVSIPKQIDAKQIREGMGMSQQVFAKRFGFDLALLEDWEQGRLVPMGLARNLLMLLQADPQWVRKVLSSDPES